MIAVSCPNCTISRNYASLNQIGLGRTVSHAQIFSCQNPTFLKLPEDLGYRPQPPDRQELAAFLAANKLDIHAIKIAVPPEYMVAYTQLTARVADA